MKMMKSGFEFLKCEGMRFCDVNPRNKMIQKGFPNELER